MIAVDTNILVHAHRADSPFHEVAKQAMSGLAEGDGSWAIPWACVHEFLAKVTHPRIFKSPTPTDLALEQVQVWVDSPMCRVIAEPDGYFDVLRTTLRRSKVGGAKVHDARIAALCVAHGVDELWTADRDFSRFALKVTNPLTE